MSGLEYEEMTIQNYFLREDINIDQKRMLFRYRTRMADYGENFRAGKSEVICPLCKSHKDSQALGFVCPIIKSEMIIDGTYPEGGNKPVNYQIIRKYNKVQTRNNEALMAHVHIVQISELWCC